MLHMCRGCKLWSNWDFKRTGQEVLGGERGLEGCAVLGDALEEGAGKPLQARAGGRAQLLRRSLRRPLTRAHVTPRPRPLSRRQSLPLARYPPVDGMITVLSASIEICKLDLSYLPC